MRKKQKNINRYKAPKQSRTRSPGKNLRLTMVTEHMVVPVVMVDYSVMMPYLGLNGF